MNASKVFQGFAAVGFVIALAACGTGTPASPGDGSSSSAVQSSGAPSAVSTEASSSGGSTTASSNAAQPTLVSKADAKAAALVISSSGANPADLEISVGQTVSFSSGDGSFHGLVINGLASVTVAKSLPEFYQFTAPGEYQASDELSSWKATIRVK